ncbi:MAG: glycosyltransferase [Verrucomicrobia bacterium]|nr:glycosyltransferase [Verrucomicrobiota bacterium]
MKLLFITPGFVYPLVGGQSIRTHYFLKELHTLGAEITAITMLEPGSDGAFLEVMHETCAKVIPVPVDPDRPLSNLRKIMLKLSPTPTTMIRYFNRAFNQVVRDTLATQCFDALLCDQLHMASYCHRLKLPKILNTDDPLYIQLQREAAVCADRVKAVKLGWEGFKYRVYEKRMFGKFDAVLFVSASDRDLVQKDLGCRNIQIIPQGVDITEYHPSGPSIDRISDPFILLTGMMNYAPNAASAVYFVKEVLPLIRRQCPGVGCMIVGAYPTDEVKALAVENDQVVVTGFVDDVKPYLRAAAVYAAPAVSGTGIKNKVLQAMAMEKAIVATPLSMDGIPQAVDGEHILVRETPDELAAASIQLLHDESLRLRLGRNARQCIIDHYSWASIVGNLYHLLENLSRPSSR